MKLPRPRFRTIPTPVIIIIEAIFVFSHVRTDPDPYHSGFVYAQSIAVQNGLLPNVNFLSPYGLVGPLINGLWLKLTSDSLLSLLVFYGTITIVTGYLIQSSIRRYVPDQLAKLINLTWVVTLATAMPWPSILTTFLTLFAILQLLRNLERMVSASIERHYYVVPVVIALQLAVLTRIHLFITPFVISVFIIINRKKVNPRFVKTWLVTNIAFACFLTFLLKALGILMPFIDQAIIWPLTAFENPRMNFSFFFSFIWFPSALFILIALVRLVLYISKINKSKSATFLGSLFVLSIFYCLYYFSVYEFVGSRTNTLRTLPGFIKTASINFQHLLGYASAMAAIIGFLFLLLKNLSRGKRFESLSKSMEFGLMGSLGITGWIQLYPLHDNVHLWFVTPLFIVPAAYYLKESVKNISMYTKPLALVFSMFLIVQSYSFYSFLSIDRVPLSSSELQGMMASTQHRVHAEDR